MALDDPDDEFLFQQTNPEKPARKAADRLFEKYYRSVSLYIRAHFQLGKDASDDLTQDTFRKAWEKRKTFKKGYSFSCWLCHIAKNTSLDYLRRLKREEEHIIPLDPDYEVGDQSSLFEEQEALSKIEDVIHSLPCTQQQCAKLFFKDHLSYEEIAQHMGLEPGTVRTYISTVRQKIHQAFYPTSRRRSNS